VEIEIKTRYRRDQYYDNLDDGRVGRPASGTAGVADVTSRNLEGI
jgi:hypothetical protein